MRVPGSNLMRSSRDSLEGEAENPKAIASASRSFREFGKRCRLFKIKDFM
jgi:hypothetical protein